MTRLRPRALRALVSLAVLALGVQGVAATPAWAHRPVGDDVRRLAPLVVEGAPRSIVTVPVAIPATLRGASRIDFTIRTLAGAVAVGRVEGSIESTRSARPLLVAIRLPGELLAGNLEVAEVEFRAAGRTQVLQPIAVHVATQRALFLSGTRELAGLRAGDRVELAFRIANQGNAPETLKVALAAPTGWTLRWTGERALVLAPRRESEVLATVGVPVSASIGDHFVTLSATSLASDSARREEFRTILRVATTAEVAPGLTLTPIVAAAASSVGSAFFGGASLDGAITEDISIRARVMPRVRQAGIVSQGFSNVGAYGTPFNAAVTGPGWEVAGGNSLSSVGDLTGVNIFGQGVTARGERGAYEGRTIFARPIGIAGVSGSLFGASLSREFAPGRLGLSGSHLLERGGVLDGRELSSFGAEFASAPRGTLSFGAGLAHRASASESGAGFRVDAIHAREGERVAVRVVHAPGGSAAFARATDELEVQVSRALSPRWTVDATASRTHDAGAVFRALDTEAYGLINRVELSSNSTVALRADLSSFDALSTSSALGNFGSGNRALTGTYERRRGPLAMTFEGSAGAVTRRTELLGGRISETVAAQQSLRAQATRALDERGTVDASVGLLITDAGVGLPADIWSAQARWSGVPIAIAGRAARFETGLEYQRLGQLQSYLVTRASIIVGVARGLDLAMSAERNPYYRDAQGRAGWIAAFRLSAARQVRSVESMGQEGVVFEDRNRNGARDIGEPGVAGVRLRRGDARAVTDRDGRYRLSRRVRGVTRLEQGSLPVGLLAHPALSKDTLERTEIPVLATGSVHLTLAIVPDEEGRTPDVSLTNAEVVLRDETGFEWVGRRVDERTFAFDDIPVGSYRARFELTRLREALRAPADLGVTVEVSHRAHVVAELKGRQVRIIAPPGRAGAGRTGPGIGW